MLQQYINGSDERLKQNVSESTIEELLDSYLVYGIEGSMLAVSNLLITIVVLLYSKLRAEKEYIIVAGQAFANGLQGIGYIAAGVGRTALIKAGRGFVPVSRWNCLLTPWNILFLWSSPWADMMLLVISIDRFLAVAFPLRYFTFTNRYGYMLVAAGYLGAVPSVVVGVVTSYQYQEPEKPAYCSTSYAMDDQWYKIRTTLRLVITFASVALYMPILFLLYRTLKKKIPRSTTSGVVASHFARLKRVTMTLGLSTLFVFGCQIIPDLLILFKWVADSPPLYVIMNGNVIANLFIYTMRFKDIRNGLFSMCRCRTFLKE